MRAINNKPSYNTIMRELGIEIISTEKSPICNSILMNPEKQGLKLENLKKIQYQESNLYFLRYYNKLWFLRILPNPNIKNPNMLKFTGERA